MLYKKITAFVQHHGLIEKNDTIILGLSGGPDSVFLLYYLHSIQQEYNLMLIAAHIDHGWRTESQQEAQFCKQLAEKLNITFVHKHASDITLTQRQEQQAKGSLEQKGRLLRRTFFQSVAQEYNAHKIALAHHFDDQIETFFIRLIRGAGLTGLTGIRPKQNNYIRPLLEVKKEEIFDYLQAQNIDYCIDPTNEQPTFLRNKIRATVVPALRAVDKRFDSSFERTHEQLVQADNFVQKTIVNLFEQISSTRNSTQYINYKKLLEFDSYAQKRIILLWLCQENVYFVPSQSFFDEIVRFLNNKKSTEHTFYASWKVVKQKDMCFIQ